MKDPLKRCKGKFEEAEEAANWKHRTMVTELEEQKENRRIEQEEPQRDFWATITMIDTHTGNPR